MLHLAGAETESPAAANREIRARTTQARRQQQTCQQRKAASLGVGAAVSNFCRSDGKEHPAEFCIEVADPSRLRLSQARGSRYSNPPAPLLPLRDWPPHAARVVRRTAAELPLRRAPLGR